MELTGSGPSQLFAQPDCVDIQVDNQSGKLLRPGLPLFAAANASALQDIAPISTDEAALQAIPRHLAPA
jgi:hypothetical protein